MVVMSKKSNKLIAGVMTSVVLLTGASMYAPENYNPFNIGTVQAAEQTQGDYRYEIKEDGTVAITKYTGIETKVTLPTVIDGKKVTEIKTLGTDVLFGNTNVEYVIVPEGVRVIGDSAFSVKKLSGVLVGSNVKHIELPSTIKTIGESAFDGSQIENLATAIPNNVEYIGEFAFGNYAGEYIKLPKNLKTLENYAFTWATSLKEVIIPEGVDYLDRRVFNTNRSLKKIVIKGEQTRLSSGIFDNVGATGLDLLIVAPDPSMAKSFAEANKHTFFPYKSEDYEDDEIDEDGNGENPEEGDTNESEGTERPELNPGGTPSKISQDGTTAETEIDLSIVKGVFELVASPILSFGDIELTKDIETYTTTFASPFNVKDLRGTKEGWRLDVSSSQFEVVTSEGSSNSKLPVGSLTLSPLDSIESNGTSKGTPPTSQLTQSTVLDDGTLTVAKADEGNGTGDFNLTFPEDSISVVIDPDDIELDKSSYEDGKVPYKAVVSWDLVEAP